MLNINETKNNQETNTSIMEAPEKDGFKTVMSIIGVLITTFASLALIFSLISTTGDAVAEINGDALNTATLKEETINVTVTDVERIREGGILTTTTYLTRIEHEGNSYEIYDYSTYDKYRYCIGDEVEATLKTGTRNDGSLYKEIVLK